MGKYKIYLHCTGKVQDIYYLYRESTGYITNCTGKVAGYIQIVQEKYWKYKNCTGKVKDIYKLYREGTGYIKIVQGKNRIY